MSATVVLVKRAGAMHKDLYEAEESCADDNGTGLLDCTLLFATKHAIPYCMHPLTGCAGCAKDPDDLFTGPEFMTSAELMRPFTQPGDMYDIGL